MEEQEEQIWTDDALGRSEDAEIILQFLKMTASSREGKETDSYVLNLDGDWGTGKTFFHTRFGKFLRKHGYFSVYLNAWEDDHASDPLLPLIASLDETMGQSFKSNKLVQETMKGVKELLPQLSKIAVKHLATEYLRKNIGDEGLAKISEELANKLTSGQSQLDTFQETKKAIDQFKEVFTKLKDAIESDERYSDPIFILIDELDRCRPTYAIEMLERVKHLFDLPGVVFVVATDTTQLAAAIKSVYGDEFESARYLQRFFNRTYYFEEPDMHSFVALKCELDDSHLDKLYCPIDFERHEFIADVFSGFDLSLRDSEQCLEILFSCTKLWRLDLQLNLLFILPMVVLFQQKEFQDYEKLANLDHGSDFSKSVGISLSRVLLKPIMVHRPGQQPDIYSLKRALGVILTDANVGLAETYSKQLNDQYEQWLHVFYADEFQKLYKHVNKKRLKSSVFHYGNLIKNAGRFVELITSAEQRGCSAN